MNLTQTEKAKLRTWVEIDRGAIKKNYQTFKKIAGKSILMAVVKSNAFGHGLVLFSKEMVKLGVNFLGVDSFEEALELRKAGIKVRILVFGYTAPVFYKEAGEKNISLTISSFENLEAVTKLKVKNKIKIHLKADTGLGRQGFLAEDMEKVLAIFTDKKKVKNIELEGLYSHLATGEDLKGRPYTMMQAYRLEEWHVAFFKLGYKPLKHICATSSAMFFPELHFDMVRIGIGMYGLWPSKEAKAYFNKKYTLYPVLSWKTIITETKKLPKGARVGYDLTEELKKPTITGIIPVGYWHGYPRILSKIGTFSVKGKKVKLLGRVSMNMIILDLTGVKAKAGDEVYIIGGSAGHYAEADMMAQDADTINYEITTRINPIIKRYYRINPEIRRVLK